MENLQNAFTFGLEYLILNSIIHFYVLQKSKKYWMQLIFEILFLKHDPCFCSADFLDELRAENVSARVFRQPDCVIDRLCVTLQVTLNSTRLTGTTSATRPRISSASSCALMSRRDIPANKLLAIHGKEMLHSLSLTLSPFKQHPSRKILWGGIIKWFMHHLFSDAPVSPCKFNAHYTRNTNLTFEPYEKLFLYNRY